jgi:nucleotide-binding universal stress UspA family protein
MFVVMALITTVATTPLTMWLYPPWYQKKLEAWKRGEIDWDDNQMPFEGRDSSPEQEAIEKLQHNQVRRLLVYLRLDSLPSLFTFIALLGGDPSAVTTKIHRAKTGLAPVAEGTEDSDYSTALVSKRPIEVHGVRMLALTDRTSSVMQVSEVEGYSYRDPVVNAFRTFAQLNNVAVSGRVYVVPEVSYAETLTSVASDNLLDLILIPWSEDSSVSEGKTIPDSFSTGIQDAFIQKTLETASCNTAIFVNRGFGGPAVQESRPAALTRTFTGLSLRNHRDPVILPIVDRSHHVYFPFFGGVDDIVALRFVLQLAQNTNITATIIHFITSSLTSKTPKVTTKPAGIVSSGASGPQLSETVDTNTLHAATAKDNALLHTLRDSLPNALANRVVFVDVATTKPVADCLDRARQEIGQSPKNAGDLVVVGSGKHSNVPLSVNKLGESSSRAETRKTLGIVAESLIYGGIKGSILVIQAGGRGLDI